MQHWAGAGKVLQAVFLQNKEYAKLYAINNMKKLTCPKCNFPYKKILYKTLSTCPNCKSDIRTDIFTINLIESTVGAPVLWVVSSSFRILLGDDLDIISYALTMLFASVMHWSIVNNFVTAKVVNKE
jgi:hypothetical protein